MVKAVTVTQYEASDGSLHSTEAEATNYDIRQNKRILEQDIKDALFDNVYNSYGPLEILADKIDEYTYDSIVEEVVERIIEYWDDLKEIMEGQ